jgi:putative flippase GtrA
MKKVFLQLLNSPIIALLFRYGIVGVVASIIHGAVSYIVVTTFDVYYLYAHSVGFVFGLFTAYFGHYFYSFNDKKKHKQRFPKFLIIALVAFTIHEVGAFILVDYNGLDYSTRVLPFLVIFVPVLTFLLNKFWVFSNSEPEKGLSK